MKAKLSITLLAVLGVPVLLASALGQQEAGTQGKPASQGNSAGQQAGQGQPVNLVNFSETAPQQQGTDQGQPGNQGQHTGTFRRDLFDPARSRNNFPGMGTMALDSGQRINMNPNGGQNMTPFVVNDDPETILARRTEVLMRKLGEAKSDTDKSEIKTELTEHLEKLFNLRQKRHRDEIAELEAKVKKLKDLVEKRQENRREIIAKRLDQILRDAEGLGW